MENFEQSIAEILEVETVNLEDELNAYESWDSLTVLSVIAFCDQEYKVALTAEEINNSKTINGLLELILSKQNA
ncbi:acyl carrier protein [Robiginitalea marina]|uniref:Phosphopantetheine-binding protein n=1 Tax=Robiginitalea marina TaxID=2954105 RepID=A0ABT1AUM4_9FLAO|nr:phosphopantetheine-binding protein [Robiginitalea marina]MCO5723312.1 phosphopantetheine-binding protein [Robiginitalea marina]